MRNFGKIMMMAALMGAFTLTGNAQGNRHNDRPAPGAPMEQPRGPRPDELIKRHNMKPKHADKFQRLFNECQRELENLNRMRQDNLARRRDVRTDKDMERIIRDGMKIDKKIQTTKEKYYKAFCAYMPPTDAERLVNQLAAQNRVQRGVIIPRRNPGGPAEPQMGKPKSNDRNRNGIGRQDNPRNPAGPDMPGKRHEDKR